MEARFGYKRDKLSKRLTALYIVAVAAAVAVLLFLTEPGYMQAWLLTVLAAVVALYILSIPHYVKVDDDYLEIHCVVEMTRIDLRDIVTIREAAPGEYGRRLLCALGSFGFFGYYGYWLDYREWDLVKVYATERRRLVVIEDIYEQRYLISCREAQCLITTVEHARELHLREKH